jgi:hypothetical protein
VTVWPGWNRGAAGLPGWERFGYVAAPAGDAGGREPGVGDGESGGGGGSVTVVGLRGRRSFVHLPRRRRHPTLKKNTY